MTPFICTNCGFQYAASAAPPELCVICSDDRQYVDWAGQSWTTHEVLAASHSVAIELDHDLLGLRIQPGFGIPQRALHLPTDAGNILWECLSIVTPEAVAKLNERGGVELIVISHPHFYSSMIEWSDALGGVPILVHEADKHWVQRTSANVRFWSGDEHRLSPTVCLYRCPGHFPGSTVLHWADAPNGKQALLVGDALHVAQDRRHVSFMYSVPNYVPSHPDNVRLIRERLDGVQFDDLYGFSWGLNVIGEARAVVDTSIDRYLTAVGAGQQTA
jgi:hypothetical protein